MSKRQPFSAAERAKIVELYRDHGLPASVIGQRYGVGSQKVRDVLHAAGVEIVIGRREYAGTGGGSAGYKARTGITGGHQ
jgi:transposase-like protein